MPLSPAWRFGAIGVVLLHIVVFAVVVPKAQLRLARRRHPLRVRLLRDPDLIYVLVVFAGFSVIWLPAYAALPWADRHGEAGGVGWILGIILFAPYWGFPSLWLCERLFVIGEFIFDVDRAPFLRHRAPKP